VKASRCSRIQSSAATSRRFGTTRAAACSCASQHAPGGILAHNNCHAADCARYDPAYWLDLGNNDNGALYGASIVDAWTTADSAGNTNLYWFLSTWNPYQVVLMKTMLSLR
jgi:hypothetical protein